MKNYSKTFVLLIAIVMAITAVIYLAKVITDDVPKVDMANLFDPYCQNMVEAYSYKTNKDSIFLEYRGICNLDSIMYAEDLINDKRHTENINQIVDIFAPQYINWSQSVIERSEWPKSYLHYITLYGKRLKNTKDAYGALVLSGNNLERVNYYLDIMERNNQAWKACKDLSYYSSRTDVDGNYRTLNGYLNDEVLKDTNLKEAIRNAKQRLCDNHYQYVYRLCADYLNTNFCYQYKSSNIADFDSHTQDFLAKVEDYRDRNYSQYNVQKKDIVPILKMAREYYKDQRTLINNLN